MDEERFREEQAALRQQLGIPPDAPEPRDAVPGRFDGSPVELAYQVRINLNCPHCGENVTDPQATFCARCGERVIGEGLEDVVRQLIAAVEDAVPQFVAQELSRQPAATVDWNQLPDTEKWKTAWGVWWRTLVVWVGIYVVLALIVAAYASSL